MTDLLVAVNVAMAVLWTEPAITREYDGLICQEAVEPEKWADGMDGDMRLWLVGKVETQVLYGEKLIVLEQRDGWLKVAAAGQPSHHTPGGYPGWISLAQVAGAPDFLQHDSSLPLAVVAVPKTLLYKDEDGSEPLMELSYQTRLPLLALLRSTVMVRLPDGGTGYLASSDVVNSYNLSFSPEGIINEARRFTGLRYIWGGTSAYGFDCSGFVMRLYQSQGITIPRDADEQGLAGMPVAEEDLTPGDLVFFASDKGLGKVHHVGIYSGKGMMIHSPNSLSEVREEPYNAGVYGEEFWGARRYFRQ